MSIVSGAFVYARGVFLPEMADDFGGSRLNITLAFSLAQAVGAFSAPFIGMALDRWHPRVVLLTGAVMVTMAYFLTALATSYLALYAVFGLLFGAGWRGISSFSTSRVLVRWFNRRRGLALSIDVAGASVAGIFVPLIAVWMMHAFGWRPGFAVFGIFTLTIVIPLVLFVIKASPQDIGQHPDGIPPESIETSESAASDTPPDEASDKSSAASDADAPDDREWQVRDLLRVPAFWGMVVVFSAMVCVFNGVNMHLFGHIKAIGFLDQRAAVILTVMGTFIVAGKPVLGMLADWRGTKTAVLLSLVAQTIGIVFFWVGGSYFVLLVGAVVYGFGMSGMAPLQSMAVAAVFGARSYGRANGLMQPFMLPIALLASPIAAWIYDTSGGYTTAFLIFLAFLLVALPVALLLRLVPARRGT
ncbi:MAG: MFS transporter [Gammaproteobacteria bacterium]|nr:MFS transporter [Gammaproteobacteria bacterium]